MTNRKPTDISPENILAIQERTNSVNLGSFLGCPYIDGEDCFPTNGCETNYEKCSLYRSRKKIGRIL